MVNKMRWKAYIVKKNESLKSEPLELKGVDIGEWNGFGSVGDCRRALGEHAKQEYSNLKNKDVVILPTISFGYNGIEIGSDDE
jgi:hypothetical protein